MIAWSERAFDVVLDRRVPPDALWLIQAPLHWAPHRQWLVGTSPMFGAFMAVNLATAYRPEIP